MEFTIVKAKLPLFLKCQQELPPNSYQPYKNSYKLQMTWERLMLFGSDAQIRHFDRLRQIYIQHLLKKHTRSFDKCTIQYIGSHSPKSDIDIELYCPNHLESIHQSIQQDHKSKYPHVSLNELYDINLYSTIYHYLDPMCTTTQLNYMIAYVGMLQRRMDSPESIAEAFSMASWGEIDTYRSIGAILHIVEEIPKLQPSLYYDSIYDNLGFIYDLMCRKSLCFKEQTTYHFVRATKYMGRILNALESIHKDPTMKPLQQLTKQINQKRKAMVPIQELTNDVKELLGLLHVSGFSQIDFLIQFTHFIQSHLPKDPFYS